MLRRYTMTATHCETKKTYLLNVGAHCPDQARLNAYRTLEAHLHNPAEYDLSTPKPHSLSGTLDERLRQTRNSLRPGRTGACR